MNKDICLKAIEDSISLLKKYEDNKNIDIITLFDPRKKSKYFISFGIVLCLIYIVLYLLSLKIYVPNIMKYLFLIIGIIIIIIGIIVFICSKLKVPIPYLNIKNIFKKYTNNSKRKISKLTKKLVINNQSICYYEKYMDKDIDNKINEYYSLLDKVYNNNFLVIKDFILEDLKENKNKI